VQFLTPENCADWCANLGIALEADSCSPKQPVWPTRKFEIPRDAGRRVALARLLWQSISATSPQSLIWVTGSGVWPSGEHRPLAESARTSWGATAPLAALPGHIVSQDESQDGLSLLVLALLFLWDSWLITSGGNKAAFVSHDEYGVAWFSQESDCASFNVRLDSLNS